MPFSDDQADLLKTAITALHSWQADAAAVTNGPVVLQQVVMNFPGNGEGKREVRFTWDSQAERFDISS
jgi:hypothetical protein